MQQNTKFLKSVNLNATSKYKSEINQKQPKSLYTRKLNHISQTSNPSLDTKHNKTNSQLSQKNMFIKKCKSVAYSELSQSKYKVGQKTKHQLKKQDLRHFIVIGVFQQKIVVCYNNKLRMFGYFDQHAMHERIRYQYYVDQVKFQNKEFGFVHKRKWNLNIIEKGGQIPKKVIGKKIICYSKVSFSQGQIFLSEKDQLNIQFLGFKLQVKKEQFCIQQHPMILEKLFSLEIYSQIAKQIIFNYKKNIVQIPKILDDIIAESSCKSAYKFNDKIPNDKISEMIAGLSACDFAFYCVHGRPTFFVK